VPEDEAAEKLYRTLRLVEVGVGVAVSLWLVWQMDKDNPLGLVAQLRTRWEAARRTARLRRAVALEQACWALDLGMYLEREVSRWATSK
jgi:hypothetical protein